MTLDFLKSCFNKSRVDDAQTLLITSEGLKHKSSILPEFLSERYDIKRVLGQGAFGIVYLAEDTVIGRLVAIKQLFVSCAEDDGIRERFIQEAKIAGQLEHPNIVVVHNIEGKGKQSAIIMQYMGGGSLQNIIEKHHTLEIRTALKIILGVLSGLDAAHHIEVIHRDIKPQNIIFGVGSSPKITDFGVAHLPALADNPAIEDDDMNTIIGTPVYMSPEQIKGEGVDLRTDLYATGVILYQLLVGHRPFKIGQKMELDEIKDLIVNTSPIPPVDLRKDIPVKLNDILLRLLDKRPENRYSGAMKVARELVELFTILPQSDSNSVDMTLSASDHIINSPVGILEDIIYLLLVDGIITHEERVELAKRTEKLGLSNIQSNIIEEKLRKKMGLPKLSAIKNLYNMTANYYLENSARELSVIQQEALLKFAQKEKISSEELDLIKRYACKKT